MIAAQAGIIIAVPRPNKKVKRRRTLAVVTSRKVNVARVVAQSIIQVSATSKSRRRSTISAATPAGTANSTTGRVAAP
jgi:hypothetical protein